MKKRLFAILLALTLALTLLPTAAFAAGEGSADLGTTKTHCYKCGTITTFKILAYIRTPIASKPDPYCHWARAECTKCGGIMEFVPDGDSAYHTGGTETPTCTTGKTCEKCGDEYGILGHDWGAWQPKGDNKTHTRTCRRDGCDAIDTADCGGDGTATCVTRGTCTGCGGQYYGGHNFAKYWDSDADTHWYPCLNENCEARKDEDDHWFAQSNMYLKSAATCISNAVYYTNCASCYYKGTDTYVYQWGQLDPNNHDGGTEIKNPKAATCTEKGYTGDTYCKGCGVKLSDGTDIPAAGHDWAAATCTTPKTCKVCKVTEGDVAGHTGGTANCHAKAVCEVCKQEYGTVDATKHDGGTEIKNAKAATCTEKGYTGDTYCKGCNAKLSDGKDIPAAGHKLKHVPAKNPTTFVAGNIEYWYCTVCGKYFRDAAATKEITKEATVTHKESAPIQGNKTVESSKTGDAGVMLYAGMAVLSLTGCAWLRRKEK